MNKWAEWGSDHELVLVFPRPGAGYVYVAWGVGESRPLYVGKAVTPSERILFHIRHKPWAKDVVRWEVRGFPNEGLAEVAEIEAIHDLDPIHNVTRRLTQAQWAEQHRLFAERDAEKAAAREKAAEVVRARWDRRKQREATKLSASMRPVSPHPRKPKRRVKWRDDVFTPDQMAIIARVQNRGRPSHPTDPIGGPK